MAKRDYYDILKSAEDKFKEAAEAYEVLSDEDKKARYDRFGHAGVNGQGGFGGGGGINIEDIFDQFGDIFGGGSPFGDIFGGGGRRSSRGGGRRSGGRPGSNLRVKVKCNQKNKSKKVQ